MSDQPTEPTEPEGPEAPREPDPTQAGRAPQSEEEMRAAIEEEMRRVRVEDVLLQSVVSILNLTARRIAKEDEQDLEQARLGIEAVRATVGLLGEQAKPVRDALAEVQMLYAKAAGGAAPEGRAAEPPPGNEEPPKRPSGLWTPGR